MAMSLSIACPVECCIPDADNREEEGGDLLQKAVNHTVTKFP